MLRPTFPLASPHSLPLLVWFHLLLENFVTDSSDQREGFFDFNQFNEDNEYQFKYLISFEPPWYLLFRCISSLICRPNAMIILHPNFQPICFENFVSPQCRFFPSYAWLLSFRCTTLSFGFMFNFTIHYLLYC